MRDPRALLLKQLPDCVNSLWTSKNPILRNTPQLGKWLISKTAIKAWRFSTWFKQQRWAKEGKAGRPRNQKDTCSLVSLGNFQKKNLQPHQSCAAESSSLLSWCSWHSWLLAMVSFGFSHIWLCCPACNWVSAQRVAFCKHLWLLPPNRNEPAEPRSGTALPLHPDRESAHRPPHWQSGADSPQLPLRRDRDHVRPGFSFRSHLKFFVQTFI